MIVIPCTTDMRRASSVLSLALVIWTALSGLVAPLRADEADQPPHKLSEIVLPADALPEGCTFVEGDHAISMQASTLYLLDLASPITGGRLVARQLQSMRCAKDAGTVFYYAYATEADADLALGFIRGFVWGEDHPTSMHPEFIDRWKNLIVVTSFRHPGPIASRVMERVPGGSSAGHGAAEAPRGANKDFEKGKAAYQKKDYPRAEKYFRALTESMPEFGFAHLYLGHSLFYQGKYRESTPEYEKAVELANKSEKMELQDERILNDQLGMSYGLTGRLEDAKTFFEGAIKKDPRYPLYYYNLACAQAELGDLDGTLVNLRLAYERRADFLPGESYPNPRQDDSFKKYLGNPKFEAAIKEMGF